MAAFDWDVDTAGNGCDLSGVKSKHGACMNHGFKDSRQRAEDALSISANYFSEDDERRRPSSLENFRNTVKVVRARLPMISSHVSQPGL